MSDKINILIVDDQPSNLEVLQAILSSPDYRLLLAYSGNQAIQHLESHECAVVLLDIQMPIMNGFDTARAIHARPESRSTPIIFLTANQYDDSFIQEGYEAGGVDYLFKPLNPSILKAKVSVFVELYKNRQKLLQQEKRLHALEILKDQQALRESEERLSLALSSADMGIWEWDIATGKLTWSETLEKLYGFEPGEFPGTYEAYLACIHPEDLKNKEEGVQKALSEKTDHIGEHRIILPDGKIRWIHGRGRATLDADGKPVRMSGISVDITDRKLAQEALQRTSDELERMVAARSAELTKSHEFLNSLIENLPNMVFVKDAKDLRFVRFNKAGEKLLGYSRQDLLGKNDYDFFPREQADFFTSNDRAVLNGNEIVDIPEESIETREKGSRILHTKKIPVLNADGTAEYLLGISEDITEQKKIEEQRLRFVQEQAARESADHAAHRSKILAEASTRLTSSLDYQETLKQLADFLVPTLGDWCTITLVKAKDGKSERVAATHADPNRTHLIEKLLSTYPVDSDQTGGIARVIQTGISAFSPVIEESMLAQAAKDPGHLELMRELGSKSCIVTPIKVREETVGAVSLVYGTSQRIYQSDDLAMMEELGRRAGIAIENARLYEKAQRAVQLRDEFLSIASHELKTPVTSLKLQIQMARRKVNPEKMLAPPPEKLANILDISHRQVNRLTDLIDNLLDVTRIESGKVSYSLENLELSQLIQDVVDRYGDQLQEANCPVEVELNEQVPVRCDRFRMEQVVVNLLTNTMKYGAGKPVRISVQKQNNFAQLRVQDHGMGIRKDQQDLIFDRFERAVSHDNISGLGLGLYISKQIVVNHGGAIRVESEPNQGATFIVDLPAL